MLKEIKEDTSAIIEILEEVMKKKELRTRSF
ncbi:hypothetical protein SAMN00777080_1322 [Aquiflexum balticum DSM 16537]|uniref:Uncharacterized protein n=1 Tax=Aquiflexum balticum DSM 16537 TaxID=758820 RepID=A0A1W2H2B5_9BACT|nr:hypothetical protein SAMN00777080_1322 [Aquiflexum balticum DSM 16537]